uniref:Uncharacterized protein n=1 Tax=Anguilla anguilla TaxID=7936 RepID=A0A0E9TJK9_ANGAN
MRTPVARSQCASV